MIAIILAGGYSSRMGAFKPLLPLPAKDDRGSIPAVSRMIEEIKAGGVRKIAVVTGYKRELLKPIIDEYRVEEIFNPAYAEGMFSSIRAGVEKYMATTPKDGVFLLPVDCPAFGRETISSIIKLREGTEESKRDNFVVPTYRGKKGHPIYIPERWFGEILEHCGEGGLKTITDRHFLETTFFETANRGVVMDMDIFREYEEIKEFIEGREDKSLTGAGKNRRVCLIRHGKITQHEGKIFLGQTDIPLSEEGRIQAVTSGEEVLRLDLKTDRIYTSDLDRAVETAKIIGQGLEKCGKSDCVEIVQKKHLKEMNLGRWDGKLIEDVRREEPEIYAMRGKHIWAYKEGKGESFFDLQYRVCECLQKILEEDRQGDIIIVAHKGVLRVIENNLKGLDVSEPWDEMKTGEVRLLEL